MTNISIKLKLIGLVGILIAITIGIGLFGMISTHDIIAHLKADAHKEQDLAHTLELAERTEIEFKTQIQEWKNILLRGNDIAQFEKHRKQFDKQALIVQKGLNKLTDKYKKLGLETDEVKITSNLHLELNDNYTTALKKFNTSNQNSGKFVDKIVGDDDKFVVEAFDKMIHHLSAEIDNVVIASEAYAAEMETKTRNTDIALITIGSVLGIVFALLIIKSIITPLSHIVHATQQLAKGDMTAKIEVNGKNEITKLQHALAQMRKRLASVVNEVRNSATTVSMSAEEIARGNLDLSSRTEEQAASLEETSSSMEHITDKVKQNSDSAVQAVELAGNATNKAQHGLEIAQTAVNAINEIKASSEKVADIISVIDEIAFQTNLLALNASIEAERAGEQGRGFSVVANEVQKLAQRSANAANEIKTLIKSSTEKVDEGTELVIRSSQALEDIVKTSNETNGLVQRISEASQEQASGLRQVNTAVSQLEETTQQNAALVEQTTAASNSMNDQAKSLTEIMSFFRFEEQDSEIISRQPGHAQAQRNSSTQVAKNFNDKSSIKKPASRGKDTMGNLALESPSGNIDDWEEF